MSNLLAIDAGNTNIVLGLFSDGKLIHTWRILTDRKKPIEEYKDLFEYSLAEQGIRSTDISNVAISNVVPPLNELLIRIAREYFKREPFIVGIHNKLNMKIKIDDPTQLGADLIAAAVAGIEKYGVPSIIIDFGTATTFTAINGNKEFLGGTIVPGLAISCEALYTFAPHLPRISLEEPPTIIGTNTIHAMQAGIITGYGHLIAGIVRDMKEILGNDAIVIATGGLSAIFQKGKFSKTFDTIDPNLVLEGIYMLYQFSAGR